MPTIDQLGAISSLSPSAELPAKQSGSTGKATVAQIRAGLAAAGPVTSSGSTMSTGKLLGRSTSGSGAVEEISIGSGLTLSGGSLQATGSGGGSYTGPVGSSGLTMTSGRLLGRYDPSTGAIQEITLGSNLSLSGNVLNAAGGGSGGGAVDSVAGLTGAILAADLKTALALHAVASSGSYNDLSGKPSLGTAAAAAASDFAPATHTHAQSDITGLSTALSGKANATHTHATSDVTGLDTALAGKASTSHTHAAMTGASSGAAGAAGFVPQPAAGDQGKVLKGDGTWGNVTAATVSVAKGTGASGSTQTFNVGAGGHQSLTVGGALTVATSNWPATGQLGELVIELINGGSALITWPTVRWVKSDGSYTTTFTSNGVLLQASGTDWIYLWSTDGGTTVWGKVMR